MGNRILKESICKSREIDSLTPFQETVFYRLIVNVDDYGIFLADPDVLTSVLYPRKRDLSTAEIGRALTRMEEVGLVMTYSAGGEKYLKIVSWEKHQRMRASRHKYPVPEEADAKEETDGGKTAETETESEEEKNPEEDSGVTEARELPVVELPLNDGSTFGVTRSEIGEYAALYPSVHVEQELRNMVGWCMANPHRRKTRSGIRRFIINWLARVQDRGGSGRPQPWRLPDNPFIRMAAGEPDEGGEQRELPAAFTPEGGDA